MEDAWRMLEETDALLSARNLKHGTLVMSAGVTGQNVPIDKIVKGIRDQAPFSSCLGSDFRFGKNQLRLS
jgi:glutamate N-acetyltransferase / amino-acid N-acetyltransferase